MVMQKILLNLRDLEIIQKIVDENHVRVFELNQGNTDNGIGYTLDIEFDTELHGRLVRVRVPVTTVEDW